MSVVAIGLDLCQIARFQATLDRYGEHFIRRVFTDAEQRYCEARPRVRATHYAGRFAVKEAVMKVLGTGWRQGVRFVDIEVVRAPGAAPEVRLHGRSAEHARARGIQRILITITHDAGTAAAVAIGVSDGAPETPR
jgi:holo-[acyl-carrier protein] synthase